MELSLTAFLLLVACLAFGAGLLGGWGGRRAAMWSTRGELAVLATQVDPRLRERMADVTGDLEQLSARVDACTSLCQSVKGDLGALKKAASKPAIGEDDLDFIVSAVSERLLKRSQVKAVPG